MTKTVRNILIAVVVVAVLAGLWITKPEGCEPINGEVAAHCVD